MFCRDDVVDVLAQARQDVKRVEEEHAAARRAVASASTRAAAAQKQKLLSGASTPGAISEARKGAGVVSMSENITASAFLLFAALSCPGAATFEPTQSFIFCLVRRQQSGVTVNATNECSSM